MSGEAQERLRRTRNRAVDGRDSGRWPSDQRGARVDGDAAQSVSVRSIGSVAGRHQIWRELRIVAFADAGLSKPCHGLMTHREFEPTTFAPLTATPSRVVSQSAHVSLSNLRDHAQVSDVKLT